MSDLTGPSVSIDGPTTQNNKHDESITTNISTEVHVDTTITDRLASLHVSGDDENLTASTNHLDSSKATLVDESADANATITTDTSNPKSEPEKPLVPKPTATKVVDSIHSEKPDTPGETKDKPKEVKKPEKSAELQRSILAGEVSDNSECSVDEGDDERGSECLNDKTTSDEEMFIEDQVEEEDVEEEEEFHEFEEERHKTSQESVRDDKSASTKPSSSNSGVLMDTTREKPVSKTDNEKLSSHKDINGSQAKLSSSEKSQDDACKATSIIATSKLDQPNESEDQAKKESDWADIMRSTVEGHEGEPKVEPKEVKLDEQKISGDEPSAANAAGTEPAAQEDKTDDSEKKELDLDEDVKNPQYIPKKGVFYEHDDRSHDVENQKAPSASIKKDDESSEVKESAGLKKAPTQDKQNDNRRGNRRQRAETDKWNHDLFRDEKQKPKSKNELINAYGYDIRGERASRNQTDNRNQRGSSNPDRQQGVQDGQRSRTTRDNRAPRQSGPSNGSRERKPRRQPNNNGRNRTDNNSGTPSKREAANNRPAIIKADSKDVKQEGGDSQSSFSSGPQSQASGFQSARRDVNHEGQSRDRNIRNDRNRRQNSKDRPSNNAVDDSKLPPITTVMPPITTWSNKIEDMVKEEANSKATAARYHLQQNFDNSGVKGRTNDQWPTNSNKGLFQDRNSRNVDDSRNQQHYNPRRYGDRDDQHRHTQFVNRNHHNDRSNQHNNEWRRTNNYNSYAKVNEPIKTQTFENSRLSQNNMTRTLMRDGRDIINERRMQNQQNYQSKVQSGSMDQQLHQQRQLQHQQHLQQLMQQPHQQQHHHHQQQMQLHQQPQHPHASQHPRPQQTSATQQQQQSGNSQTSQQAVPSQVSQTINTRHPQQQQAQSRSGVGTNNIADVVQDAPRMTSNPSSAANELINSRPIVKTDAYTGTNVATHTQQPQAPIQQHSQNHRSLGGPLAQQGPATATSHLAPSHIGTQAQYYSPSGSTRDSAAAAAAMASAYHGYMPGGHSVMDTSRYHMTSQQMSEHGYMAGPGQVNDVAAASALHQPGIYTDAASAGGTVASSAYLAQAGSTMSPSTNIPVTGAGPPPPLPQVSYLQHSQYAPPPYSNPYSQPQHNQAPPPQSSHAYPYWTYI